MSSNKQDYVSMLLFSEDMTEVAVLLKLKGPQHLIGKMTGEGGKIEPGESARRAASREGKEESDVDVAEDAWTQIGYVDWPTSTCTFFAAQTDLSKVRQMEEEPIFIMNVATLKRIAKINPHCVADDLIPLIEKFEAIATGITPAMSKEAPSY